MTAKSPSERTLRVCIIHPDLGIGGAERLVVDAAVGLQRKGHDVEIFTSHHDPKHCFEPTRDGTLKVHHVKSIFPRALLGRFHSIFAILQQLSLVLQLLLAMLIFNYPGTLPRSLYSLLSSAPPTQTFDVIFMDQQSFGVPWLKILSCTRVVFYCHFPDKDISNSIAKQAAIARGHSGPSVLRALYRAPLNLIEEGTIDYADKILVNSEFTQKHFMKSFHRLRRAPRVLYPGIDLSTYNAQKVAASVAKLRTEAGTLSPVQSGILKLVTSTEHPTLISINRFEAKKNVALALEAFAGAQKELAAQGKATRYRLVLAGGYDRRVQDNIATLDELQKQATQLGLAHTTLFYQPQPFEPPVSMPSSAEMHNISVIFLPSLPGPLLNSLLLNESVETLLYTPTDEHFGIVPLEAMACGIPVLATNTGGPMESIVDAAWDASSSTFTRDDGTGLLRRPTKAIWTEALVSLLSISKATRVKCSKAASDRVKERFSLEAMTDSLERALFEVEALGHVRNEEGLLQWGSTVMIGGLMVLAYFVMIYHTS